MQTETTQPGGDDLRSQIAAAMNAPEEPETPEAAEQPAEAPEEKAETKAERERDEQGKFKAKSKAEEPEGEVEKTAKEPAKELGQKEERIAPPSEWPGNAKVRWEGLPRSVQEAIISDYKQISEQRSKVGALDQIIEPRRQALVANYGSPEQGINYLFQLSDYANSKPLEFLQWFAQQRGIDLSNLAPQQEQSGDTQFTAALQKIQTLEQSLQGLQNSIQSQSHQSLQSHIEAFANDPRHPYFNDVRQHMAALMQGGAAKDMESAYDMACWANPAVRQQLEADKREKEEAERRQKAEQARKAAGSIGGSPEGQSLGEEPASTLRDELIRNMRASRV